MADRSWSSARRVLARPHFAYTLQDISAGRAGVLPGLMLIPGQPFIGPPAAYSLGLYADAGELLKRKAPLVMGFIGNTSPVGHLLDAVTAIQSSITGRSPLLRTCHHQHLRPGERRRGRELKYHEIDMIAPRYVVAIEQKNEVEHLVSPHSHRAGLLILRLPVSPDARISTSEARKAAGSRDSRNISAAPSSRISH